MSPPEPIIAGIHDPHHPPGAREVDAVAAALATVGGQVDVHRGGATVIAATGGSLTEHGFALSGYLHDTDAKAVRELWLTQGSTAFSQLHGAFVLALADQAGTSFAIARDVVGQRVLFHHTSGSRTTFSTDLGTVLALLPRRPEPDAAVVAARLAFAPVTAERTYYAGVRRLPPAHVLDLSPHRTATETRYWAATYGGVLELPPPEIGQALDATLLGAVADDMTGEPGLGVLLSGGIDSTSVAAAMVGLGQRPLAVSAAFPDHPGSDELSLITLARDHLGLDGLVARVSDGSVLRGTIEYVERWGVPDPSTTSFFWPQMLQQAAADGAGTIFTGEGGDERFAPAMAALGDAIQGLHARTLVSLTRSVPGARQRPARALEALRDGVIATLPVALSRPITRATVSGQELLSPSARALVGEVSDPMSWRRADGPLWWQQAYHLNGAAASSGGTFEHIERIAQTGGVQLRHPLLSRRVLEFILQMPPELTLHPLLMRPHLRGAVSHRLPAAITLRPSKSFFNDVRDDFLRRHDLDLSRTLLLGADAETAQYVNRDLVVSLLSDASPDDLWGGTLRVLAGTELFLRQQRSPEVLTALLDQLPTATVTFARSGSRSHRPDQTPPFLPPMDDR